MFRIEREVLVYVWVVVGIEDSNFSLPFDCDRAKTRDLHSNENISEQPK